ncbi:hypothetical protein L2E82_45641 [Cichorium intybus]|uniref:Uncharacterized protein n=1 Tax=Cichorium intybus TaxID=13427 RepID=A0ACB8ZTK6_CICIN|nr:hypothetical protein L2E82_45641 [Cichorium intybus]
MFVDPGRLCGSGCVFVFSVTDLIHYRFHHSRFCITPHLPSTPDCVEFPSVSKDKGFDFAETNCKYMDVDFIGDRDNTASEITFPTKRLDGDGYGAMTVGTRLEELHKSKGMQYGSDPRFTVAVKGKKVMQLLGLPIFKERATGSDMNLRAWDSGVAWQLTLNRPFIKKGSFTGEELDALVFVLKLAGVGQNRSMDKSRDNARNSSMDKSVTSLQGMGVKIYGIKEPKLEYSKSEIAWENIVGYNQQKRGIEDTILLALQSPEVYDEISRGTRCKFETNRPHAVLFEGPPGTGKTSSARVIANEAVILCKLPFILCSIAFVVYELSDDLGKDSLQSKVLSTSIHQPLKGKFRSKGLEWWYVRKVHE